MKLSFEDGTFLDLSEQDVLELGARFAVAHKLTEAKITFESLVRRNAGGSSVQNSTKANLGNVLSQLGFRTEADMMLRSVIKSDPGNWLAYWNLGKLKSDEFRFEESAFLLTRAVELNPTMPDGWYNIGAVEQYRLRFPEAIERMRRAVDLRGDYFQAHFALGMLMMLADQYDRESLEEYDWRDREGVIHWISRLPESTRMSFAPGCDNLVLVWEQGLGDTIMFARYAKALRTVMPWVKTVWLYCQPELVGLLSTVRDIDHVVSDEAAVPDDVIQFPLGAGMKAMHAYGKPPLVCSPVALDVVPDKIRGRSGKLKVGVCWRGNPSHGNDRFRSIPLEVFRHVAWGNRQVDAYSLQYGMTPDEYAVWPISLLNMSDWLTTARQVKGLDLVITCDTAIAHVAASLGVKVWLLISAYPDWRYGLESERTQWYPSMRLYRQPTLMDWKSVVDRVAADLQELSTAVPLKT